jgi:hypothetical protein
MRKEVIIVIWPNRGNNDHDLIIAIDVDSQTDERSGRALFLTVQKITKRRTCHIARV